jgi:hypothetical protein
MYPKIDFRLSFSTTPIRQNFGHVDTILNIRTNGWPHTQKVDGAYMDEFREGRLLDVVAEKRTS